MEAAKYGLLTSRRSLLHAGKNKLMLMQDALFVFVRKKLGSTKPVFDKARAFDFLLAQCAFGSRNPGSEGHRNCLQFIVRNLSKCTSSVIEQPFSFVDRKDQNITHKGTNIVASFNPWIRKNRIMLCAHWDTRPFADQDPDPENHSLPVPGANDGASGVAVLLELAHAFASNMPVLGVDLVFFDLEDMGDYDFEEHPGRNPFCMGSSFFVDNLPIRRPRFGVLLDMVGKEELQIKYEGYSFQYAKPFVDLIWAAADRVKADAFLKVPGSFVMDDHVPFLKKGIRVVNVGDFDYKYWHTVEDTPDKCCAESLEQVGNVLLEMIYPDASQA